LEQRVATIFKTVGIYLRLFLFPHPLSSDYYYNQIPLTHLGDPASFLPALITLGLAVVAVAGIRSKNPIAYGLLFFAITFSIVSNLLFSIGTTMAERFLYIPSLGLAIAAVLAVMALFGRLVGKNGPRIAAGFLIPICAAYSVKTVSRNPAWKDNYTLFTTDIKVSPNSAKIQAAVASILEEEANKKKEPAARGELMEEAIRHFRKALQIYPEHSLAWFGLGNLLAGQGGKENAAEAIQCYRHVVALEPDKAVAFRNIALTADKIGDFETAVEGIRSYRKLRPDDVEAGLLEASYLHKSGRVAEAVRVREEVARAHPRNAQLWSDMGLFFANTVHDYAKAVEYFDRAIQLDSTKVGYYENLGYAQILNKQPRAAVQTLEKGVARFGETHLLEWNLGVAWDELGDRRKSERAIARSKQLGGPR
jgi:Flp pilus assembly protein TadD